LDVAGVRTIRCKRKSVDKPDGKGRLGSEGINVRIILS
jgi:hypothetical protein